MKNGEFRSSGFEGKHQNIFCCGTQSVSDQRKCREIGTFDFDGIHGDIWFSHVEYLKAGAKLLRNETIRSVLMIFLFLTFLVFVM